MKLITFILLMLLTVSCQHSQKPVYNDFNILEYRTLKNIKTLREQCEKMANALKMPPDSSRALTIYQSAQKTEAQINTIKRELISMVLYGNDTTKTSEYQLFYAYEQDAIYKVETEDYPIFILSDSTCKIKIAYLMLHNDGNKIPRGTRLKNIIKTYIQSVDSINSNAGSLTEELFHLTDEYSRTDQKVINWETSKFNYTSFAFALLYIDELKELVWISCLNTLYQVESNK